MKRFFSLDSISGFFSVGLVLLVGMRCSNTLLAHVMYGQSNERLDLRISRASLPKTARVFFYCPVLFPPRFPKGKMWNEVGPRIKRLEWEVVRKAYMEVIWEGFLCGFFFCYCPKFFFYHLAFFFFFLSDWHRLA